MNKDVIYIEPEDDITDIIAKIEKAKEKIVALVPPKKAGVFRSLVNIKLIAKASATAEKTVVLVTVDPSIVKLAAATKLPVAKNLQSAPVIPSAETEEDATDEQTIEDLPETDEEDVVEDTDDDSADSDSAAKSAKHKNTDADEDDLDDEEENEEEEEEEPVKPAKKSKKSPKAGGNKLVNWFKFHKKLSIAGGIAAVAIIGFLVWAFGFAPAADVTVLIKTDSRNFSETANFVTEASEEDTKEGKLYLEQKKYENTQEVTFDATGEKNQGEKAIGELVVYVYSDGEASGSVSAGDVFTYNGLRYVAVNGATLAWNDQVCAEQAAQNPKEFARNGCRLQATIRVEAANPGENYNVAASSSGWSTLANVSGVRADKPITGGSDKVVKVVQQSDVINAEEQLTTAKEAENKQKLYDSISDDYYIIEVSFNQETSNATVTPAVDEEVTDGTTPKLTVTTTATVYVVEKSKIEEFIREKADLEDDQKIYDIKDIYVESLSEVGGGFTGRLKAQYYVGPKITESEVVEKISGKGLGDAQRELRDLYGVSDVHINTSYPWVMTIPSDSNKVSVTFEVKDQNDNADSASDSSSDDSDTENNEESEN